MPKQTVFFIVCLVLLVPVLAYNYWFRPFAELGKPAPVAPVASLAPVPTSDPTTISGRWSSLSPRARVAQLIAAPVVVGKETTASPAANKWSVPPGAVTLFGSQITRAQATIAIAELKANHAAFVASQGGQVIQTPLLIAVDHEGGLVQRLSGEGFTQLPAWNALCQKDSQQAKTLLAQSAAELRSVGVQMVWAPVADLATTRAFQSSRMCGSEPSAVSQRVREAVEVYTTAGLIPVIKHFPGIGQVRKDLHREFEAIEVSKSEVEVFRSVLKQFPDLAVMVTHVGITNQFGEVPCSVSRACIDELRANFPKALVVTDAIDMKSIQGAAKSQSSFGLLAREAILSGSSIITLGPSVTDSSYESILDVLEREYKSDDTFASIIDERGQALWQWQQLH
jgi:beta-N-acetylhexosaminidase